LDERTQRNSPIFTLETTIGVIDLLAKVSSIGPYEEVEHKASIVYAFDRLFKDA
jgi:hypothetical protein